jgi:flavin reductase (DIM6/NTAB) family NADH-FMN oxidoreductase RutF
MLRNEKQKALPVSHCHLPLIGSRKPSINEQEFKDSMAGLTFSVAVVTARTAQEEIGRTVTSFMPLSAVPPRLMISIDVRSRLIDLIGVTRAFSISFLSVGQEAVGDAFAGKWAQADRFGTADWDFWPSGNRRLDNAILAMDCELTGSIDAGDHMLFVGTILEAERPGTNWPLLWSNRSYLSLAEADQPWNCGSSG